MDSASARACRCLALLFLFAPLPALHAGEDGWTVLLGPGKELDAWRPTKNKWLLGGDAALNPDNPRRLVVKPGLGVVHNGTGGNLLSKEDYADVEVHVEFLISKGSNSGVKMQGLYEIQILDSHGVKKLSGNDCGGIYPRAEDRPHYHHIDDGVPPRVNAAKTAGEWQTLDMIFVAPRFDASGKKIANARFVKVVLNGQLIHDNVELLTPTGSNWKRQEIARGPLYLQADHGPVAFRNVRIRPYTPPAP